MQTLQGRRDGKQRDATKHWMGGDCKNTEVGRITCQGLKNSPPPQLQPQLWLQCDLSTLSVTLTVAVQGLCT